MLLRLFSKVFGVKESIFGVKKAKILDFSLFNTPKNCAFVLTIKTNLKISNTILQPSLVSASSFEKTQDGIENQMMMSSEILKFFKT